MRLGGLGNEAGQPGNGLGPTGITEGNLISHLFFVLAQILLSRWVVETLLVWLWWKQIAVGGEHNFQFL